MTTRNLTLSVRGILFPKETRKKKPYIPKPQDTSSYPAYHSRVLVFDTETTTDKYQNLLFGQAWVIVSKTGLPVHDTQESDLTIKRYLFVHDDIKQLYPNWPMASKLIEEHVQSHSDYELCPSSINTASPFWPVSFFKKEVFLPELASKTPIIGFNLPFDISRISIKATIKDRESFRFYLLEPEKTGYYPTITIKPLDSKKAFIRLSSGGTATTLGRYRNLGHNGLFLDLRTAIFALTNESHSLYSATHKLFPSDHAKTSANDEHGSITRDYLEYNRQDVHATYELYKNVMHHYKMLHPQLVQDGMPIEHLYSPASVGKAYFRSMNVLSFLKKNPQFPKRILGYAMSSFYAGRTECHIRNTIIKTCHVDLHSQYPSVFVLADLWQFVIASTIDWQDDTKNMSLWMSKVTLDDMLKPENWKKISGICLIKPDNDWLPVRGNYASNMAGIGWNYLKSSTSLWYTVADVIASKLKTGKMPKIEQVIMFKPDKPQTLKPILTIGGKETIDYTERDLFKDTIEKRTATKKERDTHDKDTSEYAFLEATQLGLKIFANATSYGINIELNEEDKSDEFDLYGLVHAVSPSDSWEKPGPFFNPILATLITGNAHLLIYLAQALTEKYHGTYAVMDTDSLFIVDEKDIGKLPHEQTGHPECIANKVIDALKPLYPYDDNPDMMLLEKESDNKQAKKLGSPLYVFSVSSKRYASFALKDGKEVRQIADKEDIVIEGKSHGLAYISPHDEQGKEVRNWRDALWSYIIRCHLQDVKPSGMDAEDFFTMKQSIHTSAEHERQVKYGLPVPTWEQEAIRVKYNVSTPFYFSQLRKHNDTADYLHTVKPYNFMNMGIMSEGYVFGSRSVVGKGYCQEFHTITLDGCEHKEQCPFQKTCLVNQPYKPVSLDNGKSWFDLYTNNEIPSEKLKSYGEIFLSHDKHPELKFDTESGHPCGKETTGLLFPTHVKSEQIKHIGKEMPRLEEELTVVESVTTTDKDMAFQREYKISPLDELTNQFIESGKILGTDDTIQAIADNLSLRYEDSDLDEEPILKKRNEEIGKYILDKILEGRWNPVTNESQLENPVTNESQLENHRSREYWKEIRKEFKKALKETTQKKLACDIGISPSRLSLFLNNKSTFDKSNEEKVLAWREQFKAKQPNAGKVTIHDTKKYGPNLLNCEAVGKVYSAYAKFPDKALVNSLLNEFPKQFKELNGTLLVIMHDELEAVAVNQEKLVKESQLKEAINVLTRGKVMGRIINDVTLEVLYRDIVGIKIWKQKNGMYNPNKIKIYWQGKNPHHLNNAFILQKDNPVWFQYGLIPTFTRVKDYLKKNGLYKEEHKSGFTYLHQDIIDLSLVTGITKRKLAGLLGKNFSELPDKPVLSAHDVFTILGISVTEKERILN